MALSDACYEFNRARCRTLKQRTEAAEQLFEMCKWYEEPPFDYGEELKGLKRACVIWLNDPTDEGWKVLKDIAQMVQTELDKIPLELLEDEQDV